MAGLRVELLAVLTGTLLLLLLVVSVRGWERINETQLLSLYKTGLWDEETSGPPADHSINFADKDEGLDFDDEDDGPPDDTGLDRKNEAAGEAVAVVASFSSPDSLEDPDVEAEEGDSGPSWPGESTESDFQVEFEDTAPLPPPSPHLPRSWPGSVSPDTPDLTVACTEDGFEISATGVMLSDIAVLGSKEVQWVMHAPTKCYYRVNLVDNILTIPFEGCHVRRHADGFSLQMLFIDSSSWAQISNASCVFGSDVNPRSGGRSRCCRPGAKPTPWQQKAQNCDVPEEQQVTCGDEGISSSDCEKKGCCMDESTDNCYYPMDECTTDQHFVFAIRSSGASVPVDPTKLVVPGDTDCKPVIVNDKFAIYKFKVTECGTRVYEVGEMKIYLAEVQTVVKALNLKYGIITRSDPLRFMIECRYSKCGTAKQSLASVGYMVKTPTTTLPSSIFSNGLYGVQLRIAKDDSFSSYFPTYHQPLRLLLGKPVYLELLLKSPKPDAVVLVNYCLAYPRSAKNALVLIYEGCANPNDPTVSVLKVSDLKKNRFQRRFIVNAFQFMEQKSNKYLDEEIYFMCSTEVCRPSEKKCEERCFDGKKP